LLRVKAGALLSLDAQAAQAALALATPSAVSATSRARLESRGASVSQRRAPVDAAREGLALAEKLGLGPEQGHCLRTLGDIVATIGDTVKANELRELARARFRSLGMKRWAERPWL
jgi:hypothetical protein